MKGLKTILLAIWVVMLWSCGRSDSTEVWQKERNNIVEVEVVSIEDSLLPMHAQAYPIGVIGDTLIFKDSQATDYLFNAFDVSRGITVGRFGKFGSGPGEIANFGGIFINPQSKILYGMNYSQWACEGLALDSAICNKDYKAFVVRSIADNTNKLPFTTSSYINDSTVICSVWYPNEDWTSFSFRLGRFTPQTGVTEFFGEEVEDLFGEYPIAVSRKYDLIVATGNCRDEVLLFDLNGNLRKRIYGKSYDVEKTYKKRYNDSPIITDDRIYFVHQPNGKRRGFGKEIVELDHEGNYLRTLQVGIPIVRIVYHKKTNRLYFSSVEDPQFGYIQL